MRPVQIEVRRSTDRFTTTVDGLSTRHSFSFGRHYDPDNVGFGPLMVHNEELIQVARGYDDHPHRDAEIVTWVLSGALRHSDSVGHTGLVVPRLVQRMSAGSGVVHAERNDGFRLDRKIAPVPVHFVQTWLRPDVSGAVPTYAQDEISEAALGTDWVPAVSGDHRDRAVGIGVAAATLWVTTLAAGASRWLPEAGLVHAFVARGEIEVESVGGLGTGDVLRVSGGAALRLTTPTEAELMVWSFR